MSSMAHGAVAGETQRWRHNFEKKILHKICDSYFRTHEL